MIERKTLRIGNLIKHKSKAPALQTLTVIELREDSVICLDYHGFKFGLTYEDAEGILLTQEILNTIPALNYRERCLDWIFKLQGTKQPGSFSSVGLINKKFEFRVAPPNTRSVFIRNLKFVHELQNVFQTFRLEELAITF